MDGDSNVPFDVAHKELRRIHTQLNKVTAAEIERDPGNEVARQVADDLAKIDDKWARRTLRLAAFALVKSGKSSLINALLGDQYLPSANTPETASVVHVRHSPNQEFATLSQGDVEIVAGIENIQEHLRDLNSRRRNDGADPLLDEYVVHAPLACLATRQFGDLNFEILDTPGYNEAGGEALRSQVMRLLLDADAIIYVLDYTKLKTDEERELFEYLARMRPELIARLSERLFFVVNKIDMQNRSGLTPEETQSYVASLLSKQINGLVVPPDRVLLVSAEQALLARLLQRGHASADIVSDAAKHLFGLAGKKKTFDDCAPLAGILMESSNLDEVEERVFSYIASRSGEIFLQSLVDDCKRQLAVLRNNLMTVQAGLETTVEKLAQDISAVELDLDSATKGFQDVVDQADATVIHIEEWVKEQFAGFRTKAEAELRSASQSLALGGGDLADVNPRRGPLHRAFGRLFSRSEPGAQGDSEADRERVETLLAGVNADIAAYLDDEFTRFWGLLEQEAWDRQRELFDRLTASLEPLARQVEQTVSHRLKIELAPVKLSVPTSSLEDLHRDLTGQIANMVRSRVVSEDYQKKEKYLVKEGGWCSDDEYGTRNVTATRFVRRYEFDQDQVLAYWLAVIDERTEVSVRTGRALVKRQVGVAVTRARREIEGYRDGYLHTLRKTLADSQAGDYQRREQLIAVTAAVGTMQTLDTDIARCDDYLKNHA